MRNQDVDYEPIVMLPSGAVFQGIYDVVVDLLHAGHRITISPFGDVQVSPPVHEDCLYSLSRFWRETAVVVEWHRRVH